MEDKESTNRPILSSGAGTIIVLAVIFLIIGIVRGVLSAQVEKAADQVMDYMGMNPSGIPVDETSFLGTEPITYKEVSLKIPKGWTYEGKVLENGLVHQIYMESSDLDSVTLSWVINTAQLSNEEYAQILYDTIDEAWSIDYTNGIVPMDYFGDEAYGFDLVATNLGFKYFGKCFTFRKGGYLFSEMRFSELRSHLGDRFNFIEETMEVQ